MSDRVGLRLCDEAECREGGCEGKDGRAVLAVQIVELVGVIL